MSFASKGKNRMEVPYPQIQHISNNLAPFHRPAHFFSPQAFFCAKRTLLYRMQVYLHKALCELMNRTTRVEFRCSPNRSIPSSVQVRTLASACSCGALRSSSRLSGGKARARGKPRDPRGWESVSFGSREGKLRIGVLFGLVE